MQNNNNKASFDLNRAVAGMMSYEESLSFSDKAAINAENAEHKEKEKKLPKWHKADTGLSPTLLRCALFNVTERDKGGVRPTYTKQEPAVLHSANGDKITFVGEELRQDDESVLLAFIKMAAGLPTAGTKLKFTPRSLIKTLGWSASGVNVDKLEACIARLHEAYVLVLYANGDKSTLSFVGDYTTRAAGEEWEVLLAERLVDAFAKKVTYLKIEERAALKTSMQTWLYGFIEADSCAERLSPADMRVWSGSRKSQDEFNRDLRTALEALQTNGLIASYSMSRTGLTIVRGR